MVAREPRNFDLSGITDPDKLAQILEQMIFTSAKDWRRYLYIDCTVRDLLVRSLLHQITARKSPDATERGGG